MLSFRERFFGFGPKEGKTRTGYPLIKKSCRKCKLVPSDFASKPGEFPIDVSALRQDRIECVCYQCILDMKNITLLCCNRCCHMLIAPLDEDIFVSGETCTRKLEAEGVIAIKSCPLCCEEKKEIRIQSFSERKLARNVVL